MAHRSVVSKQLGRLLAVLSHPHRLRIVEELGSGELDVNALQALLAISHSGVSQHLSVLRAHSIAVERRIGRHVHYRLSRPELASWLMDGLRFIEPERKQMQEMSSAVRRARSTWGGREP